MAPHPARRTRRNTEKRVRRHRVQDRGAFSKQNIVRRVEAPAARVCPPTLTTPPTTRFPCCDPLARSVQMPYTTGVRTLVRTSERRTTGRCRAAVSVGGQDGRRESKDDFLDGVPTEYRCGHRPGT